MGAGYHDGGDLAKRQYLSVWLLHWEWWDINFQVDRLSCGKTYATGQWLQQGVIVGSLHPFKPMG